MRSHLLFACLLTSLSACAEDADLTLGAQCELNSECEAPLVCRLGRCRTECAVSRDCPLGARCVVDNEGLGSCTLEEEGSCAGATDCPDILRCVEGSCRNVCEGDEDCARDATCEAIADRRACFEAEERADGGAMPPDAGPRDASPRDAGPEDAAGADAGSAAGLVPCDADPGLPDCLDCTMIDVSAGGTHSCAVRSDGRVFCWGSNSSGQLGVAGGDSNVPVAVPGIEDAVQVSAGVEHTCARLDDATLRCWGSDLSGQLGEGGADSTGPSPVTVADIGGVLDVSAGSQYTCAALGSAGARCWGADVAEALGNGAGGDSDTPGEVLGLPGAVQRVAAGDQHVCALADGEIYCWGANQSGQLGRGSTSSARDTAVRVDGLSSVSLVTTGSQGPIVAHTCALVGAELRCWGDNSLDQLGDGTDTDSLTPVTPALSEVIDASAGPTYTCAVLSSGEIWCWGTNSSGETTGGEVPERLGAIDAATRVSAGGAAFQRHACALVAGGVACWGANGSGQLGNGLAALDTEHATPYSVCGLD